MNITQFLFISIFSYIFCVHRRHHHHVALKMWPHSIRQLFEVVAGREIFVVMVMGLSLK